MFTRKVYKKRPSKNAGRFALRGALNMADVHSYTRTDDSFEDGATSLL